MIENKWRQDVRHVVVEVLIIVIAAIVIYYLLDRTTSSAPTTTQTVCRSWGSCNPGQGTRYRVNAQSYLLCPTPYDYSIAVCSRNETIPHVDVVCTFAGVFVKNSSGKIDDDNWDYLSTDGGSWIPDEFVNTVGSNKSPPRGIVKCIRPS